MHLVALVVVAIALEGVRGLTIGNCGTSVVVEEVVAGVGDDTARAVVDESVGDRTDVVLWSVMVVEEPR